jgi:Rad3-related DNA helicase
MSPHHRLSLPILEEHFPRTAKYRRPWEVQTKILQFVADESKKSDKEPTNLIIESGTGTGKTAVEYTIPKAIGALGGKTNFVITPNKTLVDQIRNEFPDMKVALGRNEHACLYYHDNKEELNNEFVERLRAERLEPRADEIPCIFLSDCPHRVIQETGKTMSEETTGVPVYPCPYYQQKYEAKQGGVVLASMSFYLFTRLFSKEFEKPDCLVIDEAHRIAEVIRSSLSYDITDYHIEQLVELLHRIKSDEADKLEGFLKAMKRIVKRQRSPGKQVLLKDEEIQKLIDALKPIDGKAIAADIKQALRDGLIDRRADRTKLKKLETVSMSIRRYIHTLGYCMTGPKDNPLNYVCAFYEEEVDEDKRVQYKLVIKCFYVAGLVKAILGNFNIALSATIGNRDVFGYETGINGPKLSVLSPFSAEKARIYMPTDTPNLATKNVGPRTKSGVVNRMVRAAQQFAKRGHRSLFVTISNDERELVMNAAKTAGLNAISYGNGVTAREAALRFRDGEGDALIGTAANYAEGVDLPKQIAPVIWFLRPGYPSPEDPLTQFEEKRFGNRRWQRWQWKVILQALQVRGRNIRSTQDVGVTFFISQQFKGFLFGSLPEELANKAYRYKLNFDECVKDAMKLLS